MAAAAAGCAPTKSVLVSRAGTCPVGQALGALHSCTAKLTLARRR